jgi:dihydrolipoamide dehydrogenase
VLATGARARTFPGIQPDGERVLTYREAIVLDRSSRRASSCSAPAPSAWSSRTSGNAMGRQVTVIEAHGRGAADRGPRVRPSEVRKAYEKSGITVRCGARSSRVERDGDGCAVTLVGGEVLEGRHACCSRSASRPTPRASAEARRRLDKRGFVEVDDLAPHQRRRGLRRGRLLQPGAGLAHTATRQAHVCVERIAGHHAPDVDYGRHPVGCTYCQPQVASVGLTEEALKAAGVAYKVGKFPFAANGRRPRAPARPRASSRCWSGTQRRRAARRPHRRRRRDRADR